ncbi:MAG: PBP1A family penicillin-binding protein, partial [Actinomycetota bacterium]|nr:PBP1A family penicillin-binding protein [Actinomycetota bacterium]
PEEAALPALGERSVVHAADGTVLAILHDEVDRRIVPLGAIPPWVQDAVIAAEDRKFWEHAGYDVEAIGRAFVANARARDITQGGSTITQQLAKSLVGDEQTVERKISELVYAVALEKRFTKQELLERYLNLVYFGNGAYGIAAAAEQYFGKDPGALYYEEAALLAAMIRSPNTTDPRRFPDAALERRNAVLRSMADAGSLTRAQADFLVTLPVTVIAPPERAQVQPHFVEAVKASFLQNPAFGVDYQQRYELLFSGGLRIHTTLNPRLQQIAKEVISARLNDTDGPTGAVAAVDPRDGRVLAVESGLPFAVEQYNLATQGRRQPGSAFKPFVYAAALQVGFPAKTRLDGNSPKVFRYPGAPQPWEVNNYGGADYGRVDMRRGLVKSINTAAAQLMLMVGEQPVEDLAARMGIDIQRALSPQDGPAIALGGLGHGVTPLEMASAYGTFANGGRHVQPYLIDRVVDRAGQVLFQAQPQPQQVLDPAVNATMVDFMRGVVREGTGTGARLPSWDTAGKTGTTQRNTDAWFVGYTPVMSTAVWMGHPDAQVSMPGRTGGSLPAAMWRDFMTRALEGVTPTPFPAVQAGMAQVQVGASVRVPDVRRMTEAQALQALGAARLAGQVRAVAANSPAGTVVWQSPRAGASATVGDPVYLGLSTGRSAGGGSSSSRRR